MGNKDSFVEQRKHGDYAVRRANSERASAVENTQAKAIAAAHKIVPTSLMVRSLIPISAVSSAGVTVSIMARKEQFFVLAK